MRQLIQIVQTHMDQYGVSEAEVARRIGTAPQTVNTWRNGEMKQLPRQLYLRALAELTQTDYTTVLTAALADTGYLAEPLSTGADYAALIVSLAIDADELELAAAEIDAEIEASDVDEVKTVIAAVRNLVNEVNTVADAIHSAASLVFGGNDLRLRQLKREMRRDRREQTDRRRYDVSFRADPNPIPDTDSPEIPGLASDGGETTRPPGRRR
jgi:transcriptional regulator with XRE-family HTH domain